MKQLYRMTSLVKETVVDVFENMAQQHKSNKEHKHMWECIIKSFMCNTKSYSQSEKNGRQEEEITQRL